MHRDEALSATHEMYLKALHRLSEEHPVGRVRDLAGALNVTPGSVSTGLNKLHEMGLVDRERYGGARLTPAGAAVARCVVRRFDTLKALLVDVFGVAPEQAEADACRMEHAVSPGSMNRMAAILERLRAGESIDLESLKRHRDDVATACVECEAAGFCLAVESAAGTRGH